jgi:hypothetical protein
VQEVRRRGPWCHRSSLGWHQPDQPGVLGADHGARLLHAVVPHHAAADGGVIFLPRSVYTYFIRIIPNGKGGVQGHDLAGPFLHD